MDKELSALAEPTRRVILYLIRDKELTAGEIASHFTQTRPAISQHLKVLREARLVTERREGVRRYYRAELTRLDSLLDRLRVFWTDGMDNLKRVAEEEERNKRN